MFRKCTWSWRALRRTWIRWLRKQKRCSPLLSSPALQSFALSWTSPCKRWTIPTACLQFTLRSNKYFWLLKYAFLFQIRFFTSTLCCLRLKTIELVIRNTQGAEDILKKYEDQLRKVYTVPKDTVEVETYRTELKVTEMSFTQCLSPFHNAV